MTAARQLTLLRSRYERPSIEERFEAYIADHPETWRLFVRFTLELIAAGRQHYSADAVLHRIRWHTAIERGDDGFKVNNDFSRPLSEKWAREFPEHAEFFRRRGRA